MLDVWRISLDVEPFQTRGRATMRTVREITSGEENLRLVQNGPFVSLRRDPVEPEPVGTLVLIPFRVAGYDPDCDGSLMARLDALDSDLTATGWTVKNVGLYGALVVEEEELKGFYAK